MTPEQALMFLDQIISQIALNRQTHAQVIAARVVLAGAIGLPTEESGGPTP